MPKRKLSLLNRLYLKIEALLCFFACVFLTGCLSGFSWFSKSEKSLLKGNCLQAAKYFSRILKPNPKQQKFALRAAESCESQKAYQPALIFYEALLPEIKGREAFRVKKKIAEILFYQIKNYEKALKYYYALLQQVKGIREQFDLGYQISKCFYHLGKHSQALLEVNKILKFRDTLKNREKAVLLKSSLLVVLKDYKTAIPFFRKQIEKYPKRETFFREYLALVFENQAKILLALKELERIKPSTPFLEKKIRDLRERLDNQPGVAL